MKNRKILSAVVTAAILVGSVTPAAYAESADWTNPAPAAQADTPAAQADAITTLDALKTALAAGGTVQLGGDIDVTEALTVSAANTTIDLNGHKLTVNVAAHAIEFTAAGAKITDTAGGGQIYRSATGGGQNKYILNVKGGNLTIDSGSLLNEYADGLTVINVTNGGSLTVSGTADLKSTSGPTLIKIDECESSKPNNFTMTGGKISSTLVGGYQSNVTLPNKAPASADGSSKTYAGAVLSYSNATISGGEVEGIIWASAYTIPSSTTQVAPKVDISGTAKVTGWLQIGSDFTGSNAPKEGTVPEINVTGNAELNVSVAWTSEATNKSGLSTAGEVNIDCAKANITSFVVPEIADGAAETFETPSITIGENTVLTVKDGSNVDAVNKLLPDDYQLTEVDETGAAVKAKPCTALALNKTTAEITIDGTETLTATATPADTTDKVEWDTSDAAVATVADGVVTGLKAGTATITATCGDQTATCAVTVTEAAVAVESVTLNKTAAEIAIDGTETLTATVLPATATDKTVTWTSSDATVATVDATGKVTGVKAGTATITAKSGDKTATCAVTVKAAKADDTATALAAKGQKKYAAVLSADGKTYEQDCVLVLSADDVKNESVTVTVKANDWTASKEVKVCYKTVVYTNADGSKDTVTSEGNFLIAVHVKNLPAADTAVEYSFK